MRTDTQLCSACECVIFATKLGSGLLRVDAIQPSGPEQFLSTCERCRPRYFGHCLIVCSCCVATGAYLAVGSSH